MTRWDTPSILLATTQQGISGLYSLSSLYQLAKFLYVIFLWTSNTWREVGVKYWPMSPHHTGQRLRPHHNAGVSLVVVGRMHALESLLPGRVPKICRGRERKPISSSLKCKRGKSSHLSPRERLQSQVLTDWHRLVAYWGCVFVESQSVGGHLLSTTEMIIKALTSS